MYLPTLPIIPIPQSSKSNYPVSCCCAHNALTWSSHLLPPPADLPSFTKISCNLPLAPDLWQDPRALRSFGIYSCQLSFPTIFFMRAGFLGILDWVYLLCQLRQWVPDAFIVKKSRFCCSTSALLFFPAQKQIYRVSYRLLFTLQWSSRAAQSSHRTVSWQQRDLPQHHSCRRPQIYIFLLVKLKWEKHI